MRLDAPSYKENRRKVIARYVEKLHDSGFLGYSGQELASILNSLCRMSESDPVLFAAASRHLRDMPMTEFISEKHIGLIFNAYARAGIADRALFSSISSRVESQIPSMSSQTCGNICHAFGKLSVNGEPAESLVPLLCNRLISLPNSSSQELSNAIYSLARLGITNTDSVEPLVRMITQRMYLFNPVEVAAVATAMTKLRLSDKDLLRALQKRVEKTIEQYSSYELTAVLHAFSQLSVATSVSLFEKANPDIFRDTNPHTACIALCAYGRMGILPSDGLTSALVGAITKEQSPQYLVDVLYSLSRFDSVSDSLMSLILDLSRRLTGVEDFPVSTANVNQLIYGIKKLNNFQNVDAEVTGSLLHKSIVLGAKLVKEFDEKQLANLLHAFASSKGVSDRELRFCEHLSSRITEVTNPQLFASCLESFAKLNLQSPTLWNTVERRIRVVVPDSPTYDVRIAQALAHVGRLKTETATVLLKRINIDRLSVSSSIALMYTLLYAETEHGLIAGPLGTHLQSIMEKMSPDQFMEASRLLRSLEMDLTPFRFVGGTLGDASVSPLHKVHSTKDTLDSMSDSLLTLISLLFQECIPPVDSESIPWMLREVEVILKTNIPDSLKHMAARSLVDHLGSKQLEIATLCDIIHLMSPTYDALLEDVALRTVSVLKTQCTLSQASALLRVNSTQLRDTIINEVLPQIVYKNDRGVDHRKAFVS